MPSLPITLLLLGGVVVAALAAAGYAWVANHRRQALVGRTMAGTDSARARRSALLTVDGERKEKLSARLIRRFPTLRAEDSKFAEQLSRAGFDGPAAPALYAAARVVSVLVIPAVAMLALPRMSTPTTIVSVGGWILLASILPRGVLARFVRQRQERIRRALPDALDLLVVCVEAGISIDAAILRVAREMSLPYPDLGKELMVVNRKTNAGITREEALRGLFHRTGVDELRTLGSSLIQSEKWGTSITKVLRVSAHTFRRKRRQHAEKRVALAPVKMTFPLVTLILPALFIIILGPAILQLINSLRGIGS